MASLGFLEVVNYETFTQKTDGFKLFYFNKNLQGVLLKKYIFTQKLKDPPLIELYMNELVT